MRTSALTLILALGASVLALAAAPTASAAAESAQVSATVKYSDLNIASPEGASAVYNRIRATARDLCGDRPDIHDFGRLHSWRTCVKNAVDSAVGRLDSPMVAAFNGGRPVMLVKVAQAH